MRSWTSSRHGNVSVIQSNGGGIRGKEGSSFAQWSIVVLLLFPVAFTGYLGGFQATTAQEKDSEVAKGPAHPTVELRLERHVVTLGEMVRLRELIPKSYAKTHEIRRSLHFVERLAFFHFGRQEMVFCRHGFRVSADPAELFGRGADIPGGGGCPYPRLYPYSVRTRHRVGIEFAFRASRSGIYLIDATWTMKRPVRGMDLKSDEPVLLIVNPKRDCQGRAIRDPITVEETVFSVITLDGKLWGPKEEQDELEADHPRGQRDEWEGIEDN